MQFSAAKYRSGVLCTVALAMALSGCSMCQAPFDYCGPVVSQTGCLNCDFNARRGSVFVPMEGDADPEVLVPHTAPAWQAPAAKSPAAFDGADAGQLPAADQWSRDTDPEDADGLARISSFGEVDSSDEPGGQPAERSANAPTDRVSR